MKKSNKYFKLKVGTFDEAKNKIVFHKNVKLIVKIKIANKQKHIRLKQTQKMKQKFSMLKN